MKRWQDSCIGALLVLLIGGSSLLFLVPFGGAMIAAMPPLFDRLTAYALCPDATDYSYRDYNFGVPTTSSLGAAFSAAGICGGAAVLFLMILAAIVGAKLVKPKVT